MHVNISWYVTTIALFCAYVMETAVPHPISPNQHWSWVSPKLQLKPSTKSGWGHFASTLIKKDEALVCWAGKIVTGSQLDSIKEDELNYILQVEPL